MTIFDHMKFKIWQHILFWVLVYSFLTHVVADWFQGYELALYFISFQMPVIIGTSYFFNYFLVPRYLFTRRFGSFILYTVYMLIVSLCMECVSGIVAFLVIIHLGVSEVGVLITDVFTLGGILYFVVLFMSFILLVKHYFMDQRILFELEEKQQKLERGYFTIRSQRKNTRIRYSEVLYIESLSDYVQIHLEDGEILSSKEKISRMEELLPEDFVRIHRSFLVNREKVRSFNHEQVVLGSVELPVSRTYKQAALESLSVQGS